MKFKTYLLATSVIALPFLMPSAQVANAAEQSAAADAAIDEIVVTANRREQVLSTVPISIAAFSTAEMDAKAVRNIDDIARNTPGITLGRGFSATNSISIRGVSSAGPGTTGIYINDSPIQTRSIGVGTFNVYPLVFDLERVEVLRGPQGTLFGSGSQGGTVRFITPTPSLTESSVYARVEGAVKAHGSENYEAGVAYGTPLIVDKLGMRGSAWFQKVGGFIDKADPVTRKITKQNFDDSENKAMRLDFKYALTDRITISPSIYFQEQYNGDINQYWEEFSNPSKGEFISGTTRDNDGHDQFKLWTLNTQYEGDGFDVTLNSSYFDRYNLQNVDYSTLIPAYFIANHFHPSFPNYPAYAFFEQKQKVAAHEARIQSSGDTRFKWIGGVFWTLAKQSMFEQIIDPLFDEVLFATYRQTTAQRLGMPVLPNDVIYDARDVSKDEQIAGFGEASYEVFDGLTATVGLRYASMKYRLISNQNGPFNGPRPTQAVGTNTEDTFNPKFNLSWQVNEDTLYYATVSKGFRPGGINQSIPYTPGICKDDQDRFGGPAPAAYKSDTIWSYEAGLKNSFLDRRLYVAASVYHLIWKNKQLGRNACGLSYLDNGGEATSEGFEIEARFRATPDLTIGANVGYIDAENSQAVLGGPNAAGVRPTIIAKGDSLVDQPWTINANVQYDFFAFDQDAYFRADYEHRRGLNRSSGQNPATSVYNPDTLVPTPTNFVTARVGVRKDMWDVSLFVKNLTDSSTQTGRFFDRRNVKGLNKAKTFQPRTIGITATARY